VSESAQPIAFSGWLGLLAAIHALVPNRLAVPYEPSIPMVSLSVNVEGHSCRRKERRAFVAASRQVELSEASD